VENNEFTVSAENLISVKFSPEFKKETNMQRRVKHNENFKLNCESYANPEVKEVSWFFSKELKGKKKKLDETSSTLGRKMNSSLTGFFECIAENSFGKVVKNFTLIHTSRSKFELVFKKIQMFII
jgi:hypothetical protein